MARRAPVPSPWSSVVARGVLGPHTVASAQRGRTRRALPVASRRRCPAWPRAAGRAHRPIAAVQCGRARWAGPLVRSPRFSVPASSGPGPPRIVAVQRAARVISHPTLVAAVQRECARRDGPFVPSPRSNVTARSGLVPAFRTAVRRRARRAGPPVQSPLFIVAVPASWAPRRVAAVQSAARGGLNSRPAAAVPRGALGRPGHPSPRRRLAWPQAADRALRSIAAIRRGRRRWAGPSVPSRRSSVVASGGPGPPSRCRGPPWPRPVGRAPVPSPRFSVPERGGPGPSPVAAVQRGRVRRAGPLTRCCGPTRLCAAGRTPSRCRGPEWLCTAARATVPSPRSSVVARGVLGPRPVAAAQRGCTRRTLSRPVAAVRRGRARRAGPNVPSPPSSVTARGGSCSSSNLRGSTWPQAAGRALPSSSRSNVPRASGRAPA